MLLGGQLYFASTTAGSGKVSIRSSLTAVMIKRRRTTYQFCGYEQVQRGRSTTTFDTPGHHRLQFTLPKICLDLPLLSGP
jgi:signal recognition particle receptor subunit beta